MNPKTAHDVQTASFHKLRPLLDYLDQLDQRADLEMLRGLLEGLRIAREGSSFLFSSDCISSRK